MNHSTPGLPCPSPTPGVYRNSCPSSWWYHPTISSSVVPFSSCPQSFPAAGSFQMSQLFTSGGQSARASASASVLPMTIQDWSPLGWTGWISLQSKGLSRVFCNTTVQKHPFFGTRLYLQSNSHIHTWPLEKGYTPRMKLKKGMRQLAVWETGSMEAVYRCWPTWKARKKTPRPRILGSPETGNKLSWQSACTKRDGSPLAHGTESRLKRNELLNEWILWQNLHVRGQLAGKDLDLGSWHHEQRIQPCHC